MKIESRPVGYWQGTLHLMLGWLAEKLGRQTYHVVRRYRTFTRQRGIEPLVVKRSDIYIGAKVHGVEYLIPLPGVAHNFIEHITSPEDAKALWADIETLMEKPEQLQQVVARPPLPPPPAVIGPEFLPQAKHMNLESFMTAILQRLDDISRRLHDMDQGRQMYTSLADLRTGALRRDIESLTRERRETLTTLASLMESGSILFENAKLEDGKVWQAGDLRRMGLLTVKDMYRRYCERVVDSDNRLKSTEFTALVYWTFCQRHRDAAGNIVITSQRLIHKHATMLRIRIPDEGAFGRHRAQVRAAEASGAGEGLPSRIGSWVWQFWITPEGEEWFFTNIQMLFSAWGAAGYARAAVMRSTLLPAGHDPDTEPQIENPSLDIKPAPAP